MIVVRIPHTLRNHRHVAALDAIPEQQNVTIHAIVKEPLAIASVTMA